MSCEHDNVVNLYNPQGDTLSFGMYIYQLDQDLDGAYLTMKQTWESSEYIFQKSLNNGISKVDDGVYRVRVAPEDTEDVNPGSYVYDLVILINGDKFTVIKGAFYVEPAATKLED